MKIAVISPNKQHVENIMPILQAEEHAHTVLLFEGGLDTLNSVADREFPELIIMESVGNGHELIAALEGVSQRHASMKFIILCQQVSSDDLIQAMRIGVRDVLPIPVATDALKEAVARIEHSLVREEKPPHKGRVLAFIPCKGGSGATFLATNLAYVLAAEHGKRVVLLDLNLQFGDAALFMSDSVPDTTLADVAQEISRVDASFLTSSLVHVLPNFGILAAPENPVKAMDVTPEDMAVLLKLAVTEYDYVILDCCRNMDLVNIKALDQADMIFLVLQETLPFVRNAKRLISTLQSLDYNPDKVHLIVNRYEKGGDLQLDDVERTLGLQVKITFCNSYETVAASVNQGMPILKLAKRDPVTKALLKLGQDLERGDERGDGREHSSWLGHLFRHD